MFIPESDPTPKYIITPHTCMEPHWYGDASSGPWLDGAMPLDAALMTTAPEVKLIIDRLFEELIQRIAADGVVKHTKAKKTLYRINRTCKVILLNLYVAYLLGIPVRYSRDSNRYSKGKRYGKVFLSYSRIIACVKAFEDLGLIGQNPWVNDREKGLGRQTRMWATPYLIGLFKRMNINRQQRVFAEGRTELIELRDEDKNPISYSETKQTLRWRENLTSYNDYIEKSVVLVGVTGSVDISLNALKSRLYNKFISGELSLVSIVVNRYQVRDICNKRVPEYKSTGSNSRESYMTHTNFNFDNINNELRDEIPTLNSVRKYTSTASSITCDDAMHLPLLSFIIRKHLFFNRKHLEQNKQKVPLASFSIHDLAFIINSKQLYRVFSRGSFELGGRFYSKYQTLPKELRRHIFINGQPTVELDYSAHHIRMVYHLEGIDYKEDPYLAITDDPEERIVFKLLLLVTMNAEDEESALGGFRNKNRDKLKALIGDLKDITLKPLLARIKEAHPQIAKYIHADAGVKLQYLDSQITEAILLRMTEQDIPCLPIHDSYIVPAQHEKLLLMAMMEEYRKVMGFGPVVE